MSAPFAFRNYPARQLEIIDTTLREGQQSSLLHDHYKYFFSHGRTKSRSCAR